MNARHMIGIGLMFTSVLVSRQAYMSRNAPMQIQALMLAMVSSRYLRSSRWSAADVHCLRMMAWALEFERTVNELCAATAAAGYG